MPNRIFLYLLLFLGSYSTLFAQDKALEKVYVVQLGAFKNPDISEFNALKSSDYIYAEALGKGLSRVLIGMYSDNKSSTAAKDRAQKAGFKDAFIKSIPVNSKDQFEVVNIETYDWQEPVPWSKLEKLGELHAISLDKGLQIVARSASLKTTLTKAKQAGFAEAELISYPAAILHLVSDLEKGGDQSFNSTAAPMGQIQGARPSVRGLQEVLKSNLVYTGAIDGIYGQETKLAFDDFSRGNRRFANYKAIIQTKYQAIKSEGKSLEEILASLEDQPKAGAERLVKSENPIAKIYLAYLILAKEVTVDRPQETVDAFMEKAKNEIFKSYEGAPGFNVGRQYSYESLDLLFEHFGHMQNAYPQAPNLPCWIIQKHKDQILDAFGGEINISSKCDPLNAKEDLQILYEAAWDLCSTPAYEQGSNLVKQLQNYRARRIQVYLTPSRISGAESNQLKLWEEKLDQQLTVWGKKEALNQIMVDVFKAAYYQSVIELEDHFANNFAVSSKEEAHSMAIRVLQTIVELPMVEYLN